MSSSQATAGHDCPRACVVALPHAYELDDAPDFERFYLVSCPQRFPAAAVVDAVSSTSAGDGKDEALELELGDDCQQQTLLLRKERS